MEFRSILESVKRWLFVSDEEVLLVTGAYIANLLDGPPVWLMMVGPPSSGKTDLILLFINCPNACFLSKITPKTLLSGHERAEGGLLSRVPNPVIFILKDFGTIQSLPSSSRNEILAQFREMYDGRISMAWGVVKGPVEWNGKAGVLAAGTQAVEEDKDLNTVLGERFLYFHIKGEDRDPQAIIRNISAQSPAERERLKIETQMQVSKFMEKILRKKGFLEKRAPSMSHQMFKEN